MKLRVFTMFMLCILLTGCTGAPDETQQITEAVQMETTAVQTLESESSASLIVPLPDITFDTLENSILNVSLSQGCFYQDASGDVFLRVQIYSYEKFDMVDISGLKAGDRILLSGEEITVTSVERNYHGTVLVNGGQDEGGFDLATDDSGVYYVHGYSDMKSWNPVCETQYLVSDTFIFTDSADPEAGEAAYTAGELLTGIPGMEYGYQPQNTMVRIENGQAVSMNRIYTP